MTTLPQETRRVTYKDGLVHLVEVRQRKPTEFESWMWCERGTYTWEYPPFTDEAATCLGCLAAGRPWPL